MKIKLLLILIFLIKTSLFSQVKIGDSPSMIHSSSILELESTDKAIVISRMSNSQMSAIVPLRGALVYNTDEDCVFMYDGTSWKNLCNTGAAIQVSTQQTPPINNNLGDFWINDTQNNTASIWDGNNWIAIDNNPRRGNGIPNNTTITDALAGDVYVDTTTGIIYAYDGTDWVSSNTAPNANNGLLIDATNTIQLGGVLIKPTTIQTDTTNTLAITGLENGDTTQDAIVTVNNATGQLRKIDPSDLLREEVTKIIAIDNQQTFSGLTIYSNDKINVYRNGVRIDFTVINTTTIEIEPDATCYAGDEIRIIQLY